MTARSVLLCVALLAVAGCAPDPEKQAALDRERCRGYGMRPGADAFANCRMTLDLERERERRRALDEPYLGSRGGFPPYGYRRW